MENLIDDIDDFDLEPTYAFSSFFISKNGFFNQILNFEYREDTGEYMEKIENDQDFYQNEIDKIWNNMQTFMDNTIVFINKKRVFPQVVEAEIEFKDEITPYFYWVINFQSELNIGLNIYKSEFTEEILEYDVISVYVLESPLQIRSVESSMQFEIIQDKNIIKYFGYRGDLIGPTEIIEFFKP
ncbi:MAG: hypothetical protein ACTSRZ_07100 [Promethearchaeota archaeon]